MAQIEAGRLICCIPPAFGARVPEAFAATRLVRSARSPSDEVPHSMVEEGADARTAYCSMFDAESCLVAASPFYACNKPLDLSAAAVTGRGGHSAALSSRAMSSVWRVAVSLAASRDARLSTVMPCHTCRRPRGRACAPSESVDFPFQELRFRVSKRTRAMIPSDRLSRISPDTA